MRIRKLRTAFCLLYWACLTSTSYAQQVEEAWHKRLNGEGNGIDDARAVVVDGSGNVYVAGAVVNANGVTVAAIIKYNANGDFVWSAGDSAGTPVKLAQDGAGNLYMAGTTSGTGAQRDYFIAKFSEVGAQQWYSRHNAVPNGDEFAADLAIDGSGNVYVTGTGAEDYLTVKYDTNGRLQWQVRYNGIANGRDFGNALALDAGGNVYVTGTSYVSAFFTDYVTVKYNSAGVQQWAMPYDGAGHLSDQAADLAIDNAGNVYVTGLAYNPNNAMATVKYNTAGVQQWVAIEEVSVSVQGVKAIRLDGAGNVYALGYFQNSSELYRYYVVKYDNAGVKQWEAVHINGDTNPTDMAVDASGNVYVTGYSGQPPSFPIIVSQVKYDYTTVKFNSAGVREWVQTFSENADARDFARALAIDASGNVYVTGRSIDDIVTIKYRPVVATLPTELAADRVYLRTGPNAGDEVTAPVAGGQYYTHVDWRNTGMAFNANFRVEIQLNHNEVCSFNFTDAPGNSSQTKVCPTPIIWPAGSTVLTAVLDGFAQITEPLENNNTASRFYGFATFGDFELTAQVRATEDFNQNAGADFCFIYGYQDEYHYYYVMFNRNINDSRIYKVRGADRIALSGPGSFIIPDNDYHEVRMVRTGSNLQVFFDGNSVGVAFDSDYGEGGIGIGSYNDAPFFDDICIRPAPGAACSALENFEDGLAENWRALNAAQWQVAFDNGDNAYGINTSNYSNLDPLRLGEYSLFAPAPSTPCLNNGDVNADGTLTPGDALCAFQIYLSNGALPSDCDAANASCEVVASDANCDSTTTPGDALAIFLRYLQGLPPAECFAQGTRSKVQTQPSLALRTRTSERSLPELVYVSVSISKISSLSAFGFTLDYPSDKLQFVGVNRGALTADWIALEGKVVERGSLTVGGFHNVPSEEAGGEVCEIIFTAKDRLVKPEEFILRGATDDFKHALLQSHNESPGLPAAFNLYQSFPNPYRAEAGKGEVLIRFDLPGASAATVELSIYNLAGQLVRRLVNDKRAPGAYEAYWNGRDESGKLVSSGTYLYRLKAGEREFSKLMTIVR